MSCRSLDSAGCRFSRVSLFQPRRLPAHTDRTPADQRSNQTLKRRHNIMVRKVFNVLSLVLVLAVALSVAAPASAQPSLKSKGTISEASPNGVYIVQMVDSPVVAYEGGVKGLKATAPQQGKKIDPNSTAVITYVSYLNGM